MICPECRSENPESTRFCGHCGRELRESGEPLVSATMTYRTPPGGLGRGTTFAGRFEIIEEIGRGGMGTVYKAYDTKIKEVVALKLLKPEIASEPEIIERFRNEIKLARKVAHRHVCRMYDMGEDGLSYYITMEFVAGEDLKSFIRRSGHLNEPKTLDLARQIAEGLDEAHRLGVVHRDLKPQNIMIDRDGNAKIMDFGIARSLRSRGLTGTGVIIGTPEYMSPEQADAHEVDHRADIYSFGAILYEMVTGRVPFDGETPLSIVLKHKSTPAPDPKDLNAQVSPVLSRMILRCLEKQKDRRYQKMGEILEELGRIEGELPTALRPPIRKKPITTREITVRFHLRKVLIPAVILLSVIVVAALIFMSGSSSRRARNEAAGTAVPGWKAPAAPEKASPRKVEGKEAVGDKRRPDSKIDWTVFLKEASTHLKPEESEELRKVFSALKGRVDADAGLSSLWSAVQGQIQEYRKQAEGKDPGETQKSYTKSVSEMQKVLNLVNEKERADLARQDMETSKKRSQASLGATGQNLLSWIAAIKEKDAAEAYAKDDFGGARILYDILHKVYLLSVTGGDENRCLAALQGLVSTVRAEAETAEAPAREAWLYNRAGEEEIRARQSHEGGQFAESAELFILSAFLYEKARDVALDSARLGQRTPR